MESAIDKASNLCIEMNKKIQVLFLLLGQCLLTSILDVLLVGRETGREKLEFENLPAKRGYFGQKPGGFRALGPGHTECDSSRLWWISFDFYGIKTKEFKRYDFDL